MGANIAEAMAMRCGIQGAIDMGQRKMIVKGDTRQPQSCKRHEGGIQ